MSNPFEKFEPLRRLVETEQAVKSILKISERNISILPVTDITIEDRFLQITFRIDGEMLVLSWLYLLYGGKGTGTKIVLWFIKYCKDNGLKTIKIANVAGDKFSMHALCIKLGFIKCNQEDGFVDYYLKIEPS